MESAGLPASPAAAAARQALNHAGIAQERVKRPSDWRHDPVPGLGLTYTDPGPWGKAAQPTALVEEIRAYSTYSSHMYCDKKSRVTVKGGLRFTELGRVVDIP